MFESYMFWSESHNISKTTFCLRDSCSPQLDHVEMMSYTEALVTTVQLPNSKLAQPAKSLIGSFLVLTRPISVLCGP